MTVLGDELVVQRPRAARDLEPARQHAFVRDAVADAFGHNRPDVQQPGADFLPRAPREFVAQHDLADRQAGTSAVAQQIGAGGERELQFGRVLDDDGAGFV